MAIKRKNNIKLGNDMIKLYFGKIIPIAKMDGNGNILNQNRSGTAQAF